MIKGEKMRIAVKLAGAMTVALLAGCSMFHKDAPKNPPSALVEFKQTLAVRQVWRDSVGKGGDYTFSPTLLGDSMIAASEDGTIARIDASKGKSLWRVSAGMHLTAGVGADGNTIAVVGEKGQLMAFDGEGKLRWKAQATSEVLSAPAVGSGVVIIRSVDNRIQAFDAATGDKRWNLQRTVPALTLRSAPGIAIGNDTAYVALPGGHLVALQIATGAARWEVAVGEPRGATELERVADISGAPVLIGNDVCAVSYQGRVGCFETRTGNARWTKNLSSTAGIAVDERFVLAADDKGTVSAFARDTGSSVWTNKALAYRELSTPVSFGRSVAVGDYQGYIHFLSREDGAMLARVSTDGSRIIVAPLLYENNVIYQTQSGEIVAYTAD
jgi:outer membrane protein assembly factor BamB